MELEVPGEVVLVVAAGVVMPRARHGDESIGRIGTVTSQRDQELQAGDLERVLSLFLSSHIDLPMLVW